MEHTWYLVEQIKSQVTDIEIYPGFGDNFSRNIPAGSDCVDSLSDIAA